MSGPRPVKGPYEYVVSYQLPNGQGGMQHIGSGTLFPEPFSPHHHADLVEHLRANGMPYAAILGRVRVR
jgi:hypothetical protein